MENQFLLTCLLLASAASVIANEDISALCGISEPWTVWPHTQHCQKFYLCTGMKQSPFQEYSCPADYHFSKELKICLPGACSDVAPDCGSESSLKRVRNDCSRYLTCMRGGAYSVAKCSAGFYFDPTRRACLPVAITADHQCSCILPDNATLPNPNDCETYFRCHSGQAVLVQCPPGDYYVEKLGTCLPDHTGICLEKPTMPPGLSVQALAFDECIQTGGRLAPHRSNCQRYFVCARKRVLEMRCPRGQYFDAVHQYCTIDLGSECQGLENQKKLEVNIKVVPKEEPKEEQKEEQKEKPEKEHKGKHGNKHNKDPSPEQKILNETEKAVTEATAKQPSSSPEREVASYDKFSSKFGIW